VRRSDIISSQHCPDRIIPDLGKVGKHSVESSGNKEWAVLHECVARSNLTDNSSHFAPKATPLACNSGSLASGTDVLARKSTGDNIDFTSPGPSIEGADVVPDRESR